MPAFTTSGTRAAQNTVWLSPIADKYTMTVNVTENVFGPGSAGLSPGNAYFALHYCKDFGAVNGSLTSFTGAPDGTTNTAQKFIEDTSNNPHFLSGGFYHCQQIPNTRIAVIVQAAERTRIALYAADLIGPGTNTIIVGFDLVGGRIAYGPTTTGIMKSNGAGIYQVAPGGWYLCWLDFNIALPAFNAVIIRTMLDSGTGLAPQSTTYIGNGLSGVFGWRHSALPVDAWGISNVTFFDDFNDPTMKNIDLNNTQAPGFDWYVQTNLQLWWGSPVLLPSDLTVSGSAITVASKTPIHANDGATLSTFGTNGTTGTGVFTRVWTMPFLFECKRKFPYPLNPVAGSDINSWLATVEFAQNVMASNSIEANVNPNIASVEWDVGEMGPQREPGAAGHFFIVQYGLGFTGNTQEFGGVFQLRGVCQWTFNLANAPLDTRYTGQNVVYHIPDATFYKCIAGGTTNQEPPGSDWTPYTYPNPGAAFSSPPTVWSDMTAYHTYTLIVVPYNRATSSRGAALWFMDGCFMSCGCWRPQGFQPGVESSSTLIHTVDWHRFFVFCQTGNLPGSGYDLTMDYVKVMQ